MLYIYLFTYFTGHSDLLRAIGNPTHLEYLSLALRSRYPHVRHLICKRNSGYFTYDGIETGGERVTKEIESALEEYSQNGVTINKLSIVGYSLGW